MSLFEFDYPRASESNKRRSPGYEVDYPRASESNKRRSPGYEVGCNVVLIIKTIYNIYVDTSIDIPMAMMKISIEKLYQNL
jgi:hypothetical protein